MRLVSDNEELVEPAPIWKIVVEAGKEENGIERFVEVHKQGFLSFSGPLFCVFPSEEDGVPPVFCVPYHRILYVNPIDVGPVQIAN